MWGPRYSVFVAAAQDIALFTLALLPEAAGRRQRAEDLAARLAGLLDDAAQSCRTLSCREAGRALGVHPNSLRYASPTGTIAIRWDGARQPVIRAVPPPGTDPQTARLALARRYLHVYGPATPEAFGQWSGIGRRPAVRAFEALTGPPRPQLVRVRTPAGEAWILAEDEAAVRAEPGPPAGARLLPSGDAFFLLQGADRALLVPDGQRRLALWTPRVWPGCLLVAGEVAGTWRRAGQLLTVLPWRPFSKAERAVVEAEAQSLPLPGGDAPIGVRWSE